MTRWFRIPLTAAIVVAVVLLVAMTAGGANSTVFERYFPILLIVTSFATIALLAFSRISVPVALLCVKSVHRAIHRLVV